jgi:hypothetical protein
LSREGDGVKAREYFEVGCLCILDGKVERLEAEVNNWKAVEYYEDNCTCSRNYRHLERLHDVIIQQNL